MNNKKTKCNLIALFYSAIIDYYNSSFASETEDKDLLSLRLASSIQDWFAFVHKLDNYDRIYEIFRASYMSITDRDNATHLADMDYHECEKFLEKYYRLAITHVYLLNTSGKDIARFMIQHSKGYCPSQEKFYED